MRGSATCRVHLCSSAGLYRSPLVQSLPATSILQPTSVCLQVHSSTHAIFTAHLSAVHSQAPSEPANRRPPSLSHCHAKLASQPTGTCATTCPPITPPHRRHPVRKCPLQNRMKSLVDFPHFHFLLYFYPRRPCRAGDALPSPHTHTRACQPPIPPPLLATPRAPVASAARGPLIRATPFNETNPSISSFNIPAQRTQPPPITSTPLPPLPPSHTAQP